MVAYISGRYILRCCRANLLVVTYIVQVASGIMFNSWEAHYRRIGVVKFTQDGGALVTGSDDSTVAVWPMAR